MARPYAPHAALVFAAAPPKPGGGAAARRRGGGGAGGGRADAARAALLSVCALAAGACGLAALRAAGALAPLGHEPGAAAFATGPEAAPCARAAASAAAAAAAAELAAATAAPRARPQPPLPPPAARPPKRGRHAWSGPDAVRRGLNPFFKHAPGDRLHRLEEAPALPAAAFASLRAAVLAHPLRWRANGLDADNFGKTTGWVLYFNAQGVELLCASPLFAAVCPFFRHVRLPGANAWVSGRPLM
jgi:hypothetical protein